MLKMILPGDPVYAFEERVVALGSARADNPSYTSFSILVTSCGMALVLNNMSAARLRVCTYTKVLSWYSPGISFFCIEIVYVLNNHLFFKR